MWVPDVPGLVLGPFCGLLGSQIKITLFILTQLKYCHGCDIEPVVFPRAGLHMEGFPKQDTPISINPEADTGLRDLCGRSGKYGNLTGHQQGTLDAIYFLELKLSPPWVKKSNNKMAKAPELLKQHDENVRPWLDLIDTLRAQGVHEELDLPQVTPPNVHCLYKF